MSGQWISVSLARVPSITVAGHRAVDLPVAVLGDSALLHPDLGVVGVVGLDVFRNAAVTIDYRNKQLIVEDAASLAARERAGVTVKVRIENQGPSTVLYVPLLISAHAPPLEMEVDTGSRDLILDNRFMAALGINPAAASTARVEGRDQTANGYVRYYSKLPRALAVVGAKQIQAPAGATVMFQKIIHDGLVGHAFLSRHTVTFDLSDATITFAR